jgi:hypothetical protein
MTRAFPISAFQPASPAPPPSQLDLVLVAMRQGHRTLLLDLCAKGSLWHLSDGSQVRAEIVTVLMTTGVLVPAGDVMAPGAAVAAWRIRR